MKAITFNSPLNHKVTGYDTMEIVVEKIIRLYGDEFSKLKRETLMDNYHIKENCERMYIDGDAAHCLLLVDNETGDGMLVESEGYGYARKSAFIPNARAILQRQEMTDAEMKLHRIIREVSDRFAELAHTGKKRFSIEDILQIPKESFHELLVESVAETLREREDIDAALIQPKNILASPDLYLEAKPTTELKFFSPLIIETLSSYEIDWDGDTEYEQLPECDKISCADEINEFIAGYTCDGEENRGLMAYYDSDSPVNEKVVSAIPSVEIKNGELMGVLTCKVCGELTATELEELRDWWSGQASDGWGEGLEQRDIETDEFGKINVHFWNDNKDWSIMTAEEMDAPDEAQSLEIGGITM